jgi:protein-S-isoprenylcysteine O-methyltransferase Ste14
MSLKSRLVLRFSLGLLIAVAILFVPASSWRYWQAWIFLAVVFTFLFCAFDSLYKHDRELLERRLRSKEKIREQRVLVLLLRPAFFAVLLLPGFDYRLGWSRRLLGVVPVWLSLSADVLVLCGLLVVFWVFKVNSFASRTIEVEVGQKVISTGPYVLVRHPMYSGSVLIWLFISLALGSYIAWPAFALLIPFYVYRLLNEEKFLRQELPGYADYYRRTRFRLIPFVW